MLMTRNVNWQRVSPASPVPSQANDCQPAKRGGSEADDVSTIEVVGGVMVELEDGLAH